MKFLKAGDSGIILEFGNEISPNINQKISKVMKFLDGLNNENFIDLVPTYRSIIINFNPLKISFQEIKELVEKNCDFSSETLEVKGKKIIEIPVLYGGEYGPDIENIATHNNLSVEEVINIHTSGEYLIYMLGFTPGFPYLGGMDKRIATPRLQNPRTKIPAGSVGIAGEQTGIYPVESPGGWQLLGRTPLNLFNLKKDNPFLLEVGEYIKFVPITLEEYHDIEEKVLKNEYNEKRYWQE